LSWILKKPVPTEFIGYYSSIMWPIDRKATRKKD
jgi:hypothetical protein